jgi:hypothetical protein
MVINNQLAIQTLSILAARHQKTIDNFGVGSVTSPAEVLNVFNSMGALSVYNSFKQKYQPSAK